MLLFPAIFVSLLILERLDRLAQWSIHTAPCEVCGGTDGRCRKWHVEYLHCPVCDTEFSEFTPEFGKILDVLLDTDPDED